LALVTGLAAPAQAVSAPENRARCVPSFSSGITWDTTDPLYMKLVTTATVNNCKGHFDGYFILQTRVVAPDGRLRTLVREVIKSEDLPNGVSTVAKTYYVKTYAFLVDYQASNGQATCQTGTDGRLQSLDGYTFSTAMFINTRNDSLSDNYSTHTLRYVSPPVVCGQSN
jgi:hypothetical protein